MSPVGRDQANVSSPAGVGGEYAGSTAGLYADTGDKPSCDAQSLLANLQVDPAKAAAWAQALGITSADIPSFVASLTPVVLRADTAVTSHGYQDGAFTAYPAVLQAGTAVFVNSYGEPTVKCYSGNPLTKGANPQQASYSGPSWQGFQPRSVTVIQPTPTVIDNHTFVHIDNGRPINRSGKPDPKPNPGPNPNPGGGGGNGPGTGPRAPSPELMLLGVEAAQARKNADEAAAIAKERRAAADIKKAEADKAAQALTEAQAHELATRRQLFTASLATSNAQKEATAALAEFQKNPTQQNQIRLLQAQNFVTATQGRETIANAEHAKAVKQRLNAETNSNEKAGQFKMAESAAKSAEGARDIAEETTKEKEEKFEDKRDEEFPNPKDKNKNAKDKDAEGKDAKLQDGRDAEDKEGEKAKQLTPEQAKAAEEAAKKAEVVDPLNKRDANGVPLKCKGVVGPGNDPDCTLPGNGLKPDVLVGKGTESSKGTEPGKGTESSKGTEPGKGTESSKGTEPGKGTESSKGTEPGKGTESSKGTEPGKGTESSKGTEPGKGTGQPGNGKEVQAPAQQPPQQGNDKAKTNDDAGAGKGGE